MKKLLKFLIVFLLITSLTSSMVSAGFWDWLFKSSVKQGEKEMVKQEEKNIAKQTEKQVTKSEQIQINRVVGNNLDDAFKSKWCETHKCVDKISDIQKTIKPGETFYIRNDWEAKNYINLQFDPAFTRRPDMLKVRDRNGYVSNIAIYDVKTSADAVIAAEQRGQVDDYVKLCDTLNKKRGVGFCSVQYALPKEEAEELAQSKGSSILACLAIGLIMVPDPTDLLCFVAP